MNLSGKKLILLGVVVMLLVAIPATIYVVGQQQQTQSQAEKSTTISFTPVSSAATPIQKSVGDDIPLDIMVNPGKNLVSFVKLEISYDPEKLATTSAGFQANTVAFPSVLEGPVYTPGKIAVTLSVGPDPTKSIQTITKAGTVTFKAMGSTPPGTPTLVSYGTSTQALSIGSNDQASENVLSSATPATIVITGDAISPTGEPEPTEEPEPTTPEDTPTVPTPSGEPAPTEPGGSAGTNELPLCSSLTLDREANGNAPYAITFSANGTDADGTISQVTFNFGDGQVSDVTTAGGIGTNSVNVQVAHTYNNPGTFQASAVLTDSNNAVSDPGSCQQTITITASGSATSGPQSGPTATMAPTGTTEVVMGIAAAALVLIVGGGLLFFIL